MTMLIIFLLLYLNFRRVTETLIVMLSVPFALVGGFWLMWWLGFNLSVAVAVGFIALAGVAAETGVVMLIYLDSAMKELKEKREKEGRPFTRDDLYAAIMSGAVERVRPKMMTVAAIMAGTAANHVEPRHRRRGDAAYRRADDRRHGVIDPAHADRHSCDLRRGQGLFLALVAAEEGHRAGSSGDCLNEESSHANRDDYAPNNFRISSCGFDHIGGGTLLMRHAGAKCTNGKRGPVDIVWRL